MKHYLSLVLLFLFAYSFSQTIPDDEGITSYIVNDTISGGELKVFFDKEIAPLVREKEMKNCGTSAVRPKLSDSSDAPEPTKKHNPLDICANQQKVLGYKIMVFYTKDRTKANKIKGEFDSAYPYLASELVYAAPDYRVLVGDYFTKNSASSDLRSIKRKYDSAFLVQWRVWCRKAK